MSNTFEKIQEIISEALYCEKAQVERHANLMLDLGAESIDFLDIVFRLEKAFGIKLPKGEIESKARGDLVAGEFEVHGVLQEKGLSRLRAMMPEISAEKIKAGLRVKDIATLFTVATFERMVLERLNPIGNILGDAAGVTPTVQA